MSQDVNNTPAEQNPGSQHDDDFFMGMQQGEGANGGSGGTENGRQENPNGNDSAEGQGVAGDNPTAVPAASQVPPHVDYPSAAEVQRAPQADEITRDEQREAVARVAISDDIKEEWEELRKLSPEAAALAEEDSPEGEAVRSRLSNHGFESAMDRADITIDRRKKADEVRQQEQRAIHEHNSRFQTVLQREVPEVFAMSQDPARMQEAAKLTRDMQAWIERKPYTEAASLMEIYKHGRDPYQVASMIKQFQQESSAENAAPRASASADNMIAVPGRGAPVAPTGGGDKDDFYAGLSL